MPRDRRLRRLLVAASIIGIVGAWPARVDAHAVFVGAPGSVAADTDISLTMNVPHERDDTTYNVGVAIRLPEGWTGVACQSKPTWVCSIGVESGLVVIRFDKDPSAAPAEDETFRITVHSGATPGQVSFPTLQTYSTGETVAWIGPAGSAEPAPTLQVANASPATTQVAVTPTSVPTAVSTTALPAPPTTSAAPTTAAAVPTAPSAAAATTTTTITTTIRPSSTTTTTTATTSTTTTITTLPTGSGPSLAPTTTASELSVAASGGGGGGPAAAIVAIAAALLAACVGVFVYRRRRTAPARSIVDPPQDPPNPSATE